jgi:hypothetical protein
MAGAKSSYLVTWSLITLQDHITSSLVAIKKILVTFLLWGRSCSHFVWTFFFHGLFNDAFSVMRLYSVRWYADKWLMIWKEGVMTSSKYYPCICLEGFRKGTKNVHQDSWCPGQVSSQAPPKDNSRALPLDQPVQFVWVCYF